MRFEILTIFPGFFSGVFEHGIVKRARNTGIIDIGIHDIRDFTHDRHRTVDDRPFGGGEGMVLKPEPVAEALESIAIPPKGERQRETVILLSAQGQPFTQKIARDLSTLERVILICGRYEGVDERVNELFCDREISIGDYVLSGGELAACVVLDATMRMLPGVLGNEASGEYESFGPADGMIAEKEDGVPRSQHGAGGLLDYPHYTRPAEFRGAKVPDVLTGGNHDQIRKWRREQALRKTMRNRPDLLERASLTKEDRHFLTEISREHHENAPGFHEE